MGGINKSQLYLHFRSDSEYLSALDETRWLKYISELIKVSSEVCTALDNGVSVAVCYEAGWDRTTQVSYFNVITKEAITQPHSVDCVIGTADAGPILPNYGRFSGNCTRLCLHPTEYI